MSLAKYMFMGGAPRARMEYTDHEGRTGNLGTGNFTTQPLNIGDDDPNRRVYAAVSYRRDNTSAFLNRVVFYEDQSLGQFVEGTRLATVAESGASGIFEVFVADLPGISNPPVASVFSGGNNIFGPLVTLYRGIGYAETEEDNDPERATSTNSVTSSGLTASSGAAILGCAYSVANSSPAFTIDDAAQTVEYSEDSGIFTLNSSVITSIFSAQEVPPGTYQPRVATASNGSEISVAAVSIARQ